jgi:hypothetical protein
VGRRDEKPVQALNHLTTEYYQARFNSIERDEQKEVET